jgi:hypothetical protein
LLLQQRDAVHGQAAVGFQLRFARTAQTDTATDTLQMAPHPLQARQLVAQLGELDLQLSLAALRTASEDIENQFGAVDDAHLERSFEVAPLCRRQIAIDNENVDILRAAQLLDLLHLALAEQSGRMGRIAPLRDAIDHHRAGRFGQSGQFIQTRSVRIVDRFRIERGRRAIENQMP